MSSKKAQWKSVLYNVTIQIEEHEISYSTTLRIARVVIVQHALAGINPETLRYQERSTERVLNQEVVVFIYNVSSIYSPR